jgi:hypothetical protein
VVYEQRSYSGNATDTALAGDITAGALSFSVNAGDGLNYPDGSGGPAFVIVDYDNSKAEKIRYISRTGDAFTVPASNGRGVDGTSAQSHSAGAKIRHCFTATDAQEANRAALNTVGRVTSKGDLLVATASGVLTRLPAGTDGLSLVADSTQTAGVKWGGKTVRLPHTFSVTGTLAVASGADNYLPPFFVPVPAGQTATVVAVCAAVHAGTVTAAVTKNGTNVTGLAAVAVTTTPTTTSATGGNTCANNDEIAVVLSSPAGADGLSLTIYVDYTV